jgi:hypothetical protein
MSDFLLTPIVSGAAGLVVGIFATLAVGAWRRLRAPQPPPEMPRQSVLRRA